LRQGYREKIQGIMGIAARREEAMEGPGDRGIRAATRKGNCGRIKETHNKPKMQQPSSIGD
jgi:hypothetical protein